MRYLYFVLLGVVAFPVPVVWAIDSATVPPANWLLIAGSPIDDIPLHRSPVLAVGGACEPNTIDVYIDTPAATAAASIDGLYGSGTSAPVEQFLVACQGAPGTPFDGELILIAKSSNEKSGPALAGLATLATNVFLDPGAPSCAATFIVAGSDGLLGRTINAGCVGTALFVPDAAVSVVEADLFPSISLASLTVLHPQPLVQVLMAPSVNTSLYRALQFVQGLALNDLPANIPSITSAQLHALFAGNIRAWDELSTRASAPFATGASAPPGFGGALTSAFLCRRGEDSGVQAFTVSQLLNERCNASVPRAVQPSAIACLATGCDFVPAFSFDFVFAGATETDVQACLNDREALGVYGIAFGPTTSTEPAATREYFYIGVDGGRPTLEDLANGAYQFSAETLVYTNVSAQPVATPAALLDLLTVNIGDPANLAVVNQLFYTPVGDHGFVAVPDPITRIPNLPVVAPAAMRTNPISSLSRGLSGRTNHCQPPSAEPNSQIGGGDL